MMMKSVLVSAICVSLLISREASASNEIRHLQLGGAQLIWTSDYSYAITHPTLLELGWKSVTVNDRSVTVETPQCNTINLDLWSLSEEQKKSLAEAKANLESINEVEFVKKIPRDVQYCSTIWRLDVDSYSIGQCKNLEVLTADHEKMLMQKHEEHQFTAGSSVDQNLARVFFNQEVVTFVYRGGRVLMRPLACLHELESVFIDYVRNLFNQAEVAGNVKEEVISIHQEPWIDVVRFNKEPWIDVDRFGKEPWTGVGRFGRMLLDRVQSVRHLAEIKIKQIVPRRA